MADCCRKTQLFPACAALVARAKVALEPAARRSVAARLRVGHAGRVRSVNEPATRLADFPFEIEILIAITYLVHVLVKTRYLTDS